MAVRDFFNKYYSRQYLNPFSRFFESKETPHARTLRTGLAQKFKDTWLMFSGESNIYTYGNKSKSGLLDYAMLQIPALITLIKVSAIDALRKLPWPAKIFFGLPLLAVYLTTSVAQLALVIIKYLASLAIALIALPFIAIVQTIMYAKAHSQWKELEAFFEKKTLEDVLSHQQKIFDYAETFDDNLTEDEIEKKLPPGDVHKLTVEKHQDTIKVYLEKKTASVLNTSFFSPVVKDFPVLANTPETSELASFESIEQFKASSFFKFNVGNVVNKFEAINTMPITLK